MTPDQALNHFGNQRAIAEACDVSPAAVSLWVSAGKIPWQRQIELERASGGAIKHTPEDIPASLRAVVSQVAA